MLRTRVAVSGPVTGPAVITQHWLGSDDAAQVTAVRAALDTWLTAVAGQCHTSTVFDLETEVDIIDPANGNLQGNLTAAALSKTGSNAGDMLPLATQWMIRWRTAAFPGTREVKGRSFIPGPTRNGALNGKPTSAAVAALTTASATLAADSSANLCIWSRANSQAFSVESAQCWTKFAILRSRRD